MMNTMQAIRNTFAKPAKRANDVHLSKENQPEGDEELNSLREFRRNRVMTKPIPSQSTSVFD
ncbi:MAG: hypothetical protein ABJF50_08630 [Paracoccaceae bacterium]